MASKVGPPEPRAQSPRRSALAELGPLLAGYLVYLPLAVSVTLLARHQLNADGVAYLRIARYYGEGRFYLAVTGYWSPLLSWLLVPFIRVGADPLLAAHALNAIAGAAFILTAWYLARLLNPGGLMTGVAPVAAALLAIGWLGRGIVADPLLAALLTLYFALSYRMSTSFRSMDAAMAGGMAAVCYYTKYYSLPFFALHHLLTCFLPIRTERGVAANTVRLRCWMTGVVVFAVLALPWVTVLSEKYGRPTFATTGRVTHSFAGPVEPAGGYWPPYQLMMPREGRIATWENPDEFTVSWPAWAAWSGTAGMLHQARLLVRNAREVSKWVFGMDAIGLLYIALVSVPLMAFLPRPSSLEADPRPWGWSLVALIGYLSGFMFVFASSRRYYWPLEGLLLALALLGAELVFRIWVRTDISIGKERLLQIGLAGAFVVSCGIPVLDVVREATGRPGGDLRLVAQELAALGVRGPLASNNWHKLLPVGWRLGEPCVGVPLPGTHADVSAQLRDVGARTFLLFEGHAWPPGAVALERDLEGAPWRLAHILDVGGLRVRVYDLN